MNGFLITLEGIDGCGKTVLTERLGKHLQQKGHDVVVTREPGGSALGKHLREILNGQKLRGILAEQGKPLSSKSEFLLFAADRAHHFETVIIPALSKGQVVVSDRCADSSLAYQGYGRGLDHDMIKQVNSWAMQEVKPNLVLYLKVPIDVACQRFLDSRDDLTAFEVEKKEFWEKISAGYEEMFATRENVTIIDASQDEQTVFQDAVKAIAERLCTR